LSGYDTCVKPTRASHPLPAYTCVSLNPDWTRLSTKPSETVRCWDEAGTRRCVGIEQPATDEPFASKKAAALDAGLAVSAVPRVFRVLSRLAELPFGHLGGTKARYTTGGGLVYMGTRTYLELL
jgi:hypothetical protein